MLQNWKVFCCVALCDLIRVAAEFAHSTSASVPHPNNSFPSVSLLTFTVRKWHHSNCGYCVWRWAIVKGCGWKGICICFVLGLIWRYLIGETCRLSLFRVRRDYLDWKPLHLASTRLIVSLYEQMLVSSVWCLPYIGLVISRLLMKVGVWCNLVCIELTFGFGDFHQSSHWCCLWSGKVGWYVCKPYYYFVIKKFLF